MDIVGGKNLRHMWDDLARTHGDKTALVFEDIEGATSAFSYAQLNCEINRAANLFLGLGIGKGDRVAVQLYNTPEFIFCWFGLAKIGAITVPVNVHYLHNESEYLINKCGAKTVVTEEKFYPVFERLQREGKIALDNVLVTRLDDNHDIPGTINFRRALREQPAALKEIVPLSSDDAAEIIFTSGTTSRPKGVVITHYNLLFAGRYTAWQCALRTDDRYMTMMPAFHIDFQCTAAMPTFSTGATFIMLEKYSAHRFWRQVCLHRATITECIPLMVRTLMLQPAQTWEKDHCLREVFFYLNLADQEKDAFMERFGVRFLTSYGMTETVVGIIGDRPGDERRWPSIGRTGLCYEAKIVGEDGLEVPPLTPGEICVKGVPGRTIFKEYYNAPEATAEVLSADGWLRTGDTGYMDEDGFFYFIDRNKNVIKRSGENISGSEIENVLVCHPKIVDAAVVGVPDDICDEAVKAFVILKEGETASVEEILDYCTKRLAKFKVPSFIEIRTSFPRTSTGKVQKNVLKNECVECSGSLAADDWCAAVH
ncbi:crotonobetaine/carnitine-CoA ligase [Desulfobaculum xiamenense]|uniref:Crotonobetaine/carnitine-CoA ligase n=1 Tax=Desulfobaculum xiamenense TaxID=995050 RepID=A0A846QJP9_9BACT|nr:crotonobetaine/carnitine-CoA ligase [Desulfobaculum xiamenense]NJB66403.1 crotonobetaine/carnitine-CoA ligase [Desulfobaculum xiamenense]